MLRIVTEQLGSAHRISLHGRVAGEWVALLEQAWRSIVDEIPSAKVTVVLSDVSFIDVEGERLLEGMWRRGAAFVASGCMNRCVIDRIEGQSAAGKEARAPSSRDAPRGSSKA